MITFKDEVSKKEDYQIKNEFDEIFELFDEGLLPEDKEQDLVEILRKLKSKAKYNDDDAFNPIRKMYEVTIESLFANTYNKNKTQDIIHRELFNDQYELLNIWGAHNYLSGKTVNLRGSDESISARNKPVWPGFIEDLSILILSISQRNSHKTDPINHYGYNSITFALLELLLWYKNFIKDYK